MRVEIARPEMSKASVGVYSEVSTAKKTNVGEEKTHVLATLVGGVRRSAARATSRFFLILICIFLRSLLDMAGAGITFRSSCVTTTRSRSA